jgi:hypothetical protein
MVDQTIKVENVSVEIIVDDYAESPREWCNSTKFVMFHKRLNLPNELDIKNEDYGSWDEMQEALDNQYKWVYPVFMLDHGGLAFSINSFDCPFDSGQVGFIVSDEGTPEEAYMHATSELKTYGDYANGDVYGVRVFEDTEMIDFQYGYYGCDHEDSGLKHELKSFLTATTTEEITKQILDKLS